jgi:hypothetical protein
VPTPDLARGTGQVVVAETPEGPAEAGEGACVRLRERLPYGTRSGPVEGCPARRAAQTEHLRLDAVADELGDHLVAVDPGLRAPGAGPRHEGRTSAVPGTRRRSRTWSRTGDSATAHLQLGQEPTVCPLRRVPLLVRSRRIGRYGLRPERPLPLLEQVAGA